MINIQFERKKILKYLIFIIPIMEPKIFTQFTSTRMLFNCLNLLEFACICLIFMTRGKIRKHNYLVFWILGYQVYLLMIGLLNSQLNGIMQWGIFSVTIFNLWFIFENAYIKGEEELLFKAISILGIILLTINIYTLLTYERGIISSNFWNSTDNDQYFLGIKTAATFYIFPTISAAGYLYYRNPQNRKYFILAILSSVVNIVIKQISTGMVGIIIITILTIILTKCKSVKLHKILFLSSLVAQFLTVFFNIQKYFSFFICTVLHKDVTLTARSYIWSSAKSLLSNQSILNLLFGNGIYPHHTFVPYDGSFWQPHNQLLVWLYTSGIVGTVFFVCILYELCCKKKVRDKCNIFLFIMCISILFLSTTEVYFDMAICLIPFVMLYFNNLRNQQVSEVK
ncbi:O-antigen ligase family protein [Anaerostipes faecalis]|uniref:O-antigen ligase family protein n=1 Tax=Anaerostipes faecalis TaxID=2738446 RepID=UPI003F0150D2